MVHLLGEDKFQFDTLGARPILDSWLCAKWRL